MATGTTTLTVSTPSGNRTVTVKYPASSTGTNTPALPGPYPLIMAGHGAIGTGVDSTNLLASMVDAGYIVAGPHFGNIVSNIPSGAAVVSAVIDYLTTTWGNASSVDEDNIGYTGTSMGGMIGYALMRAATDDPRISAIAVRAASSSGSEPLFVGRALYAMHGSSDTTVSYSSGQTAFNRSAAPHGFVRLANVGHDLVVTGPYYTNAASPSNSGLGGFFGYYLKGESDGITRLHTAITATAVASWITDDWGDIEPPPPPPPPPPNTGYAFAGTHCIRQVGPNQHTPGAALSDYNNARAQILGSMNVGCFVSFGLRLGWDAIETGRVLTTSATAANAASIAVATNHPALASGSTLRFGVGASSVVVVLASAAAANSASISVVGSHAAIASGARAGVYDPQVLNACYTDILPLGKQMSVRVMNGKYTPTNLITDGSVVHAIGGGSTGNFPAGGVYHEPYNAAGVHNPILMQALAQMFRYVCDWAESKNAVNPGKVPMVNFGTVPGMDYAELWYGGSGQGGDFLAQLHMTANGQTLNAADAMNQSRMGSVNSAVVDLAVAAAAGRVAVGFGISGLGNLFQVIAPAIAEHVQDTYGVSPLALLNANGWGPSGEWGSGSESTFDTNVWTKDFAKGVQDISPSSPRTSANWVTMYANARDLGGDVAKWTEIYAYQVRAANGTGIGISGMNADQAAWNQMVAQANAFNTLVGEDPSTELTQTDSGTLTDAQTSIVVTAVDTDSALLSESSTIDPGNTDVIDGDTVAMTDAETSLTVTLTDTDAAALTEPSFVITNGATPITFKTDTDDVLLGDFDDSIEIITIPTLNPAGTRYISWVPIIHGVRPLLPPVASGPTKIPVGLFHRDGLPNTSSTQAGWSGLTIPNNYVKGYVENVYWNTLQPSGLDEDFDTTVIDDAINTAADQNLQLKVRFFAGQHSPDWVKDIGGGPLTLITPRTGPAVTIPQFWHPAVTAAYTAFWAQFAERYNSSVPVLRSVALTGPMTIFAEPFLRQTAALEFPYTGTENLDMYAAAGYSFAADMTAHRDSYEAHRPLAMLSELACNPHQDATGTKNNASTTINMMDEARLKLGYFVGLGNNSLRDNLTSTNPLGPATVTQIWGAIGDRLVPKYFQTATSARVGDLYVACQLAVTLGACMVELPGGTNDYTNSTVDEFGRRIGMTPTEFDTINAGLTANALVGGWTP